MIKYSDDPGVMLAQKRITETPERIRKTSENLPEEICPICNGNLIRDRDIYTTFRVCTHCGSRHDVEFLCQSDESTGVLESGGRWSIYDNDAFYWMADRKSVV